MDIRKVALVVEDEQPLINVIQKRVRDAGFEVVSARSVKQAQEYLETVGEISFIWLDHYLLGEETGLDLIHSVKSNPKFKDIPVFVVSNTGGHDKRGVYLQLGAKNYYIKAEHKLTDILEDIIKEIESK